MAYKIGDRMGAISHSTDNEVHLLGYGVYEGDQIPNMGENIRFFGMPMVRPNPRIRLDNGKYVYGCECWWGPEDKMKADFGSRKIIEVDIELWRKENNSV
jgi:hypothetical protein